MTGASYPKFSRKLLELHSINKAPLKHAHDDEVCVKRFSRIRVFYQWVELMASFSGVSIPSAVPSGTALDITHTKKKGSVLRIFTGAIHTSDQLMIDALNLALLHGTHRR